MGVINPFCRAWGVAQVGRGTETYAKFGVRLGVGVGVGPRELVEATDWELGVDGTEEAEEEEDRCTYSSRIICIRFTEGDSISTTGFRLRGVIGTGELHAMIDKGSGLDWGDG